MNNIYTRLSNVKFLSKSYTFKFLFIAFLGIHIPLIGLIIFITTSASELTRLSVFSLTLVLTLLATAVTLLVLKNLLSPLELSKKALEDYLNEKTLPALPTNYDDEAGILMQKVQETLYKLDAILEQKKDLIGLLSHDLRSPLLNIKMLAEYILDDTISSEEIKEMAGFITKTADNQIYLMQEILEILRQDDLGWVKLKLTEMNTKELIDHVLKEVQPMAERKDIVLKINIVYDGKIAIEKNFFPQVVKNLLNNAIKFSYQGAEITLDINRINDKTVITVSDLGLGFNPEDAEELFKKFTSKRKRGTLDEPTTGMGLYLSRKIIEAHKGRLSAFSKGINQGATFTIEV